LTFAAMRLAVAKWLAKEQEWKETKMVIKTELTGKFTKLAEGLRLKPYRCPAGKLTIGYGRNIEDMGISETEAEMLFDNDWQKVEA
ncbi:MAG: hypothetical protein J6X75_05780, partial [Clostridia bacterium]|nr:hypothetical protein [Clostridia bacterium]